MSRLKLPDYIATQATESYRAFIIHGPAMSGKTRLAQRMVDVLGAYVLDLQAHFVAHRDLCARIDRYRPRDLERLLLALDVPESLVVVDNLDFLLNTWSPHHKRELVAMIDRRLRSPRDTDKTFAFLIQTDPVIVRHELTNTRGQPRILPIDAFYAL
ncbi:MAG: hypothetical protein WBW48_18515 [Anaerolineae bacterium]